MGKRSHHALALWSATRPKARVARFASSLLLRSLGPRLVPGRRVVVDWDQVIGAGAADWKSTLQPMVELFDHTVVYQPPQAARKGMALLLVGPSGPVAFVKARPKDDAGLALERKILRRLDGGTSKTWVPRVLDSGVLGSWMYVVTEPIPSARHTPAEAVDLDTLDWIAGSLRDALDEPPTEGLVPMHGDLTPWNVRRLPDGRTAIFDWEGAAWGPAGADLVYFQISSEALGRRTGRQVEVSNDAGKFWRRVIQGRPADTRADKLLADRMLAALRQR